MFCLFPLLAEVRVQLVPYFPWLPVALQVAAFAGGLFLLLALVVWLYRYESRLVAPGTARLLLGLRAVALGLLWAVLSLRPVVAHVSSETVPGQVFVALDRSDSMRIADPQRSPAEKLRLARALGLASDLASDAQLGEWIRAYEAGEPPSFRTAAGGEDAALRQAHDRVMERIDGLTREQIAAEVLLPAEGPGLLEQIRGQHAIDLTAFTQQSGELPADPEKLRAALRPSASPPSGAAYTDLRLPLGRALQRSGPHSGKALGVVILTDGQHNWGSSPVAQALELAGRELPIFPVAIGAKDPPPDIAVVGLQAPASVFKNTDATVEARLRVSNMPPGKIRATLDWPEEPEAADRPKREPVVQVFEHDGTDHIYILRFQAKLDRPGTEVLTVTAKPDPADAERLIDKHPANDSRQVRVNVAPDKAKVLIIDGEARWEYHYLASALARDASMEVKSVVFRQPRINRISPEELEKMNYPALELPRGEDAYAPYDCIILGDVPPEKLTPEERRRLESYVGERGGTLVVLAGKRSMPLAYANPGATAEEQDPLEKLLPVSSPREVRSRQGFPVLLTEEGKLTPFLQMEPGLAQSLERWEKLPSHYWAVVGRAKPGAETLAVCDPDNPAADDGEAGPRRDNALIARHSYGFGRVLFVGLESTWRWRFKTGDKYHHRFWGQVIRWAATDKPLVTGDENVRFGAREPVYRPDQSVDLLVRLGERVRKPSPGALMGARLLRPGKDGKPDEAVAMVPLTPHPGRPRELRGQVSDLPPGDYAMELVLPELAQQLANLAGPAGDPTKMRAHFKVMPPEGAELVELGTNWPLLEELAAKTGGRVYTAENAGELVEQLKARSATREEVEVTKLWQSWWTLLAFLAVVSFEWVARKWAGLP